MPWVPELFTAPALQRIQDKWREDKLAAVPYFDGLMTGESDALLESFAGGPELYDPIRGRVKGVRAFHAYVVDMSSWLAKRDVEVENVERVVCERRGFEEVMLDFDAGDGRVHLPFAIVADRASDGRIEELRIYYSTRGVIGREASRAPLLGPDPELHESDIVADYQRALAAGDIDGIVATFEPDGYAREPAGGEYIHRGSAELRTFYELLCSNGGIDVEACAQVDDGRASALEYNVVRRGERHQPPEAGVAVYIRGASGKLAAARLYDDADRPLVLDTPSA
jgi:hypothetical protein